MMILKFTILISLIISIECKQSYIIKGPGWKNEIEQCGSAEDDSHNYHFNVSTVESTGFNYEEINSKTYIKAYGDLELHTRKSGSEKKNYLALTEYVEENGYKKFFNTWNRDTKSGWAAQSVAIGLTVKIDKEGTIELGNLVYAGSWGAFSCAHAKAYVMSIEIIN